ncbi:MAG: S-layer homology domain-containing protein, partial [Oscillospiraceae bacterium]|nr:S-layer homology domain-containing protein [Oscillospiraceae bacterium]
TGSVDIFKDAADIASPYRKAVAWAVEKGITTGYGDGTFRPNDSVTRAQFVTFLWRYENRPATSGSIAGFTDAASIAEPYQQAVAWAVEKGITTGYNDGTFRPNDSVTRAQFVTFLWRYENKPATSGSIAGFTDASSIAGPYQQAVAWAVEKGITTGYGDDTFRPNAICPRWAVVLFMYRDMK